MRTYKHYRAGDLVGEFPWPDRMPVTEEDWAPVEPGSGAVNRFQTPLIPMGKFVPCLSANEREKRVYHELTSMYLMRMRARRTGTYRLDWLRYLGLLSRRTGAGGYLLPSGTWWGKLLGRPARREFVSQDPSYLSAS